MDKLTDIIPAECLTPDALKDAPYQQRDYPERGKKMGQPAETLQSFVEKLDQGHEFCVESEGEIWYLEKERDMYIVSSSANMARAPFADATEAVFSLLSHVGVWLH
jgi:hypothetical protein